MIINTALLIKGVVIGGLGGWVLRGNKDAILNGLKNEQTELSSYIKDITEAINNARSIIDKD